MAELVVQHSREPRRVERLEQTVLRVGRDPACDIVLDSTFVSREHALLERSVAGYTIQDPGSRNGVVLNGERLPVGEARTLSNGDEVQIADFTLTYVQAPIASGTQDWLGREPRGLSVDVPGHEVWFGRRRLDVHFSPQEFDLLAFLHERQGTVCSHFEIGERLWGSEDVGGRRLPRYDRNMIHQLVARLKRKLGEASGCIATVAGAGYRLEDQP